MASKKIKRSNYYDPRSSSKNNPKPSDLPSAVLDEFEPSRRLDKNPAGFFVSFSHRDFPYQDFTILIVEKIEVSGPHWHHIIHSWLQCGQLCIPYEYDYVDDDPNANQDHWRNYVFETKHVLGIRVLDSQNKADAISEVDMSNLYYYMQTNNLSPYLWTASGSTVEKNVAAGNYDNIFAVLPLVSGVHRKANYRRTQRVMYSLAAEKIPTSIQNPPAPIENPDQPVLFGEQSAGPEDPAVTPIDPSMFQYGLQISTAGLFEWYSGQFPDTPNAHMVFFDGRSFYVPNGTQIHQTLSRLLKPAGYLVCFATYDFLKVAPLLIPSKNTVAYGKYPDYPMADLPMAKSIAASQWYNTVLRAWGKGRVNMGTFVAVVTNKEQMSQIGASAGSIQDIVPFVDFLTRMLGGAV